MLAGLEVSVVLIYKRSFVVVFVFSVLLHFEERESWGLFINPMHASWCVYVPKDFTIFDARE